MDEIVTSYPPHIYRVEAPYIKATGIFPGGSGLWCGPERIAPVPELFPDAPAMIVLHNYAGLKEYERISAKGGESGSWWTEITLPLLSQAGVDPTKTFFTNALMGLKHGSSLGNMNATKEFEKQCSEFLIEQIGIVKPSVIISFGNNSYRRVKKINSNAIRCTHPSAREFNPLATRSARVTFRANELRAAISAETFDPYVD